MTWLNNVQVQSQNQFQADPRTMQQHIEISVVTSGRGKDCLIRLKIEATGLNEEKKKYVYNMLKQQLTTFIRVHNYSKVEKQRVRALLEFLESAYSVSRVALDRG